jgi:hypothetical protein
MVLETVQSEGTGTNSPHRRELVSEVTAFHASSKPQNLKAHRIGLYFGQATASTRQTDEIKTITSSSR